MFARKMLVPFSQVDTSGNAGNTFLILAET